MTHRSLSSLLAVAVGFAAVQPAYASVTFFSDRSIEKVAAQLTLPPGADVPMPVGTAARLAELAPLVAEVEAAAAELGAREPAVFGALPGWLEAVDRMHQISLLPEHRAALVEGGLEALPPELGAALRAAGTPLEVANQALRSYFEAYDRYQVATIRAQILATTLEAMLRREQLVERVSARRLGKLDAQIAEVVESERRFRIFTSHPAGKNHHRALSAIVCQRRGGRVLESLERAMAKVGLAPKRTWQARFQKLGSELKGIAQATKAGLASAPGVAKVLGYFYNPFRKEPDPEKAIAAMRSMSRGFRFGTGLKLEVVGEENVPKDRPVVFAFSHRSEVEDAILMLGAVPGNDYSFMMGQWAFPGFLSKKLAEEPTTINVGGKHADGTPVDAVGESVQTLKDGRDLVIFPEGMTPTDQGETQPLRRGIDVITRALKEAPVAVVGVSLADPANRPGGPRHVSMGGKVTVQARFHRPLDPLVLGNVPGAEKDMLRNLLRVQWHHDLFGEAGSVRAFELPAGAQGAFDSLYQGE